MTVLDGRDGEVLAKEKFTEPERLSASAPVFAGPVLVAATRTFAGGPGWIAGYTVEVEEITGLAGSSGATPGF
jgi:hypothetical protein